MTDVIVMDCRLVVDGVLEYVPPPFAYVQSKFEPIHILEWLRNYKFVSVIASAVYVIWRTEVDVYLTSLCMTSVDHCCCGILG